MAHATEAKAFQRLRRRFAGRIVPGGKTLVSDKDDKRGEEQLCPDPSFGGGPVSRGKLSEVQQGFKPFEEELYLPPFTVELSHLFEWKFLIREVGKEPHHFSLGVARADRAQGCRPIRHLHMPLQGSGFWNLRLRFFGPYPVAFGVEEGHGFEPEPNEDSGS